MSGFIKKIWKDRVTEFPTRRSLTKQDGSVELVTVAREEGTVSQEGDAFSAQNMNDLEERVKTAFDAVDSSLNGFSFRKNSEGEKEVSTDGGTTWENFSNGASADLLWTNPNPSSTFNSQKITLDLSKYTHVIVNSKLHATNTTLDITPRTGSLTKNNVNTSFSLCATTADLSPVVYSRSAKILSNAIEFGSGRDGNGSTNNGIMIPLEIYGINLTN